MRLSLSLLDAETGKLSLDWIVLTAMILGTAASVLALTGDDIALTRAGVASAPCATAEPCLLR